MGENKTIKFMIISKTEKYRNFIIESGTDNDLFFWNIYRDNRFYLSDTRTIDGSKINGVNHAINDAKKNIDAILRIDFVKYYG